MPIPMIEARDVVKVYGPVRALDGLSLTIAETGVVALLGPNGAGKTTFVRILSTLVRPDSGWARVAGWDVTREPVGVRSSIGLAGQSAAVDEVLTGRENLEMVARLYRIPKRLARKQATEVLERLGLTESADRPVRTYSGGMRRRLDLGASLTGRPSVMLLDEPTTGLDPRTRQEVWRFIAELVAEGTTLLLTTQYLEEADHLAKRIVMIDRGRVIADGTSAELKRAVGGDILYVRIGDPGQLDTLTRLLETLHGDQAAVDIEGLSVSISARDGAATLTAAVLALNDAHVLAADIGLRRPSLDDVFLSLTGTNAEVAE